MNPSHLTNIPTEHKILQDRRFHFGRDYLGPPIAYYLSKLLTYIKHFDQERSAQPLFASRAGIRIYRALEVFAQSAGLSLPDSCKFFWISRLMVAKGVWSRNKSLSIRLLSEEFYYATIRELVAAMYRHESLPSEIDLTRPELDRPGRDLQNYIAEGSDIAKVLEEHFTLQSEYFENYLASVLQGRDRVLLVDTGWQGTAQRLLADSYSKIDWWGAYFGKHGDENTNRKYWSKMMGLVLEQDEFDPAKPETCVILNRHLIESLFEPKGSLSIERLRPRSDGTIEAPEAETILADNPTKENDPIFAGVLNYLSELPSGCSPMVLAKKSTQAWSDLARIMAIPSKDEVPLLADIQRSADFGRSFQVPLVLNPDLGNEEDTPKSRVDRALWQTGQIALEYPREIAEPIQRKFTNLGRNDFKNGNEPPKPLVPHHITSIRPKVAIITRTLDRPMFLRRALASVHRQTFKDYVHVVVNDGGDAELARRVIDEADCDHSKVILVDNVINRGMEVASNIGIAASDSKYIIIHDDDDSWEPGFLAKTVDFLEGPKGDVYGGVITKSTYVSEEVTPEGITTHETFPYQDWVETVHIMEMAICNFYPPIAFLFRRDLYEKIGGFNDNYPVLGDWDFNLRYLLETDIGVIPERLANYHHRDKGDTTLFGNSVIAGRNKHLDYSSIVRNKFARNLLHSDNPAIANLVGMGLHWSEQRDKLENLNQVSHQVKSQLSKQENILQNIDEQQLQSSDKDDYWVALQRLVKLINSGDNHAAETIGLPLSDQQEETEVPTRDVFDRLLALKGKSYQRLDPPPEFDDEEYLRLYKDVNEIFQLGKIASGFEHYYWYGRKEGRQRPTK